MRLKLQGVAARFASGSRKENKMLWGIAIPAIVALVTEIIKLFNNLIEGDPPEIRKAKAIASFAVLKPFGRFINPEARAAIEELMRQLTAPTVPEVPE